MHKLILYVLLLTCIYSTAQKTKEINAVLEKWHEASAQANFDEYFNLMTKDAIFIGTDPTENWNYDDFKAFAKPYFDKGKAWGFLKLERNIFVNDKKKIAWFDELLDTKMGICRGSGILQETIEGWKIQHYVLSIAIPNENVKEITALKKKFDIDLMSKLRLQKD